ncbi:D-serine/D-alanine/glycine transporter, CycA domain protein [Mycobacterium kansasii]|uniref:D-serine/D-alanine/glycine transporter, CycA domain protein n=1 Tax=Mycobacterium kansasii TaxID=1768 RepID=A0A1V3XF40_MYCKA|nr:D-serine/D-alanine/glycine transporter, CycA domain protein [Mycobacterium kansasii]
MVVYAIIGFFVFFVLRAMGELLLSNLNYKSFVDFTADLLGPPQRFIWGGRTGLPGSSPASQTSSRSPATPGSGGPPRRSGYRLCSPLASS